MVSLDEKKFLKTIFENHCPDELMTLHRRHLIQYIAICDELWTNFTTASWGASSSKIKLQSQVCT